MYSLSGEKKSAYTAACHHISDASTEGTCRNIVSLSKLYAMGFLLSPLPEESMKNWREKQNKQPDKGQYFYNR